MDLIKRSGLLWTITTRCRIHSHITCKIYHGGCYLFLQSPEKVLKSSKEILLDATKTTSLERLVPIRPASEIHQLASS